MKSKNLKSIMLSLLVMALWGSLFPFIKIGYNVFDIDSTNVAEILMFAGVRFTISGFAVVLIALAKKEQLQKTNAKTIGGILMVGFLSIVLHYAFTYIGLATTDSAKAALVKQLGALLYICFAFLFIKEEKFCVLKIILASVCIVASSILSKEIVAKNSPFWVTGLSQFTGGMVLMLSSLILGADMLTFHMKSTVVFIYICTASTVAYVLWNYIIRTANLSKILIPLGIILGNRSEKE